MHGSHEAITTDGLRSSMAAMTELGCEAKQEIGRWANNRVEHIYLPFRRRKRTMLRFLQMKALQKFASIDGSIHNHFHQAHHLVDCKTTSSVARPPKTSGVGVAREPRSRCLG